MLNASQVKSLHIEKSKARVTDERYREILREVADVSSSKDASLGDVEFRAILKAIQGEATRRAGWQEKQLKKFKQYAFYCGMEATCARQELFKLTGKMHEENPELHQRDFDSVMAAMETRLENLIDKGEVEAPKDFNLNYWRGRLPGGMLTSRQQHEILEIWSKLQQHLSLELRTKNYLYGIAQSCLRLGKAPDDLCQINARQGIKLIEALRRKLRQEESRLVAAVPF